MYPGKKSCEEVAEEKLRVREENHKYSYEICAKKKPRIKSLPHDSPKICKISMKIESCSRFPDTWQPSGWNIMVLHKRTENVR